MSDNRYKEEKVKYDTEIGFLLLGGNYHGGKIVLSEPAPAEFFIGGDEYHFRRLPLPDGQKKGIRYYVCVSSWQQG